MKNRLIAALIVLSILGMLLTSYLTYHHYAPAAGSICTVNNTVNCSLVNKSVYSSFFYVIGFPEMQYLLGFDVSIAVVGFLTYLVLFFLAMFLHTNRGFLPNYAKRKYLMAIFALAFAGFLFSGYLSYIEAFILQAWCMFCVSQAILITFIFLISIILLRRS